jgi:hypothetical protein
MDMRAKRLTVALVAAAAGAVAYMSFAEGSEPEPEAGQASPQASKGAMPFSDGDAGCTPSAHHHCPRLEPTLR